MKSIALLMKLKGSECGLCEANFKYVPYPAYHAVPTLDILVEEALRLSRSSETNRLWLEKQARRIDDN